MNARDLSDVSMRDLFRMEAESQTQQLTTGVCAQVLVVGLQTSVVQIEASLHWVSAEQQPVIAAFEHVCSVRSQTSSVQTWLSAQLPLLVQQPAIAG